QLRDFFSLNDSAFHHCAVYFYDTARLELVHIFNRFPHLGSHAYQHTEHGRARGIQAELADEQMSSGLRGGRRQPVSRGGKITGNAAVARMRTLTGKKRDDAA